MTGERDFVQIETNITNDETNETNNDTNLVKKLRDEFNRVAREKKELELKLLSRDLSETYPNAKNDDVVRKAEEYVKEGKDPESAILLALHKLGKITKSMEQQQTTETNNGTTEEKNETNKTNQANQEQNNQQKDDTTGNTQGVSQDSSGDDMSGKSSIVEFTSKNERTTENMTIKEIEDELKRLEKEGEIFLS